MNKAILHVDGDSFFVGCEIAHRPDLRGKPVIVGSEKGIACAMSYEAKARGVVRAMPVFRVRQICPEVVVLPSNFDLYKLYSVRMNAIVARFAPHVEAYSIDECFADLTGCDSMLGISYEEIARRIKNALFEELGTTFSVGLSINKLLAKVASKWQKPDGFKVITEENLQATLREVPVSKIWGIGRSSAAYCAGLGIKTAAEFADQNESQVRTYFDKPMRELWLELNGHLVFGIHDSPKDLQKSFMSTSTFRPPTSAKAFLISELSRHAEEATKHMRRYGLCARQGSFFIKKQSFQYLRTDLHFEYPTSSPELIVSKIIEKIDEVYVPNVLYRATGISLFNVLPEAHAQDDLFGSQVRNRTFDGLESHIDTSIRKRFGDESVVLGSSMQKKAGRSKKDKRKNIFILRKI